MFFGSKFCGHCGAATVDAKADRDGSTGICPRCKIGLQQLQIGPIVMRECTRCAGIWSDVATFEKICSEKDEQAAALTFFQNRKQDSASNVPVNYVPCPQCHQLMNRSNFARSSGVIIDLCKEHGAWFDAGELPKIIDFLNNGGLARAREKELIDLQAERGKIREERRELGVAAMHFENEKETLGGGLVKGLIDSLLDL
jgi:Zn-finger nucleic acid-binding protein